MVQSAVEGHRFYSFGPFCLDTTRLLLFKDGHPVALPPRFLRLLLLLVQNYGRDLSKDYLMDELWPNTAVEENNLTVIVSGLRKRLGDDFDQHQYIVTIPGRGYRFVAEVVERSSQVPAPPETTSKAHEFTASVAASGVLIPSSPAFKVSRRPILWLGISLGVILSLMIGVWTMRTQSTATASSLHSIAVLPFESFGFGSEDEYLGLGMADALAFRLRNVKQIVVRPTDETLAYGGSRLDAASLGRMLGANLLLTGNVKKSGNRISINAKLLHTTDGVAIWSEQFSGETKEILAIQDHIAESIAGALTHNSSQSARPAQHYTADPEAYQFYLHGRYFLTHRSRSSAKDDSEKAIAYFQQAINRDQAFSLAYVGLATAYNKMSWYLSAEDSFGKAQAAAQKALSLDSNLPEAYRALAVAEQAYDWDFNAADAAYRRAIDLDPEDSMTRRWHVDVLLAMGRNQEAEHEWQKAQELDPYSTMYDTLGQVYFYSRRYKDAFLDLQGKQDVAPSVFWYLAWMYRFHKAELGSTTKLSAPFISERELSQCEIAYAEYQKINQEVVRYCLMALQQGVNTSAVTPYKMAVLYAAMKDNDNAFEWLERARQAHDWEISYIKVDPRLDYLRADHRFDAVLDRMNLRR